MLVMRRFQWVSVPQYQTFVRFCSLARFPSYFLNICYQFCICRDCGGGLVINLATVHELCDVTYLARTALIDLVYGDILRLPAAQITEFYEFMSNRLQVHRFYGKVYPKPTVAQKIQNCVFPKNCFINFDQITYQKNSVSLLPTQQV